MIQRNEQLVIVRGGRYCYRYHQPAFPQRISGSDPGDIHTVCDPPSGGAFRSCL